jgi:oligopeptide transport system substrate-binding protein
LSNSGNNRTGWKNSQYDALIHEANQQTNTIRRAGLLRGAETLLVEVEVPVVPVFFYAGFNCFNPEQVGGLHQNLLDEHPLQDLYRLPPKAAARGEPAR